MLEVKMEACKVRMGSLPSLSESGSGLLLAGGRGRGLAGAKKMEEEEEKGGEAFLS